MIFDCGGREIGSAPISVVLPSASAHVQEIRWSLSAGKAIYRENSFFQVPVVLTAERGTPSSKGNPVPVTRDVRFALRDRNGQLSHSLEVVIDRNTAISNRVLIDLPVEADYRLVAFNEFDGKASNELKVSWQEQGPRLRLVAFPDELELYAAPISNASVKVYLANGESRVKPSETFEILVSAPPLIRSEPPDKLFITAAEPIPLYKASAATVPGKTVEAKFLEPKTNVQVSVPIHVLSTFWFQTVATLAGLIGYLVGRGSALAGKKFWQVVLEVVIATAGAYLLYAAVLQGWLKPKRLSEVLGLYILNYRAAVCLGMIGGYAPLGVFKSVAILWRAVS